MKLDLGVPGKARLSDANFGSGGFTRSKFFSSIGLVLLEAGALFGGDDSADGGPNLIPPSASSNARLDPSPRSLSDQLPANRQATYSAESENFYVHARSQGSADYYAKKLESIRDTQAMIWLGKKLDPWPYRCVVNVEDGDDLGVGGETTYDLIHGKVYPHRMAVRGNASEIERSVLPHELTHVVIATHIGAPVPRWLDEGCASIEESAQGRQLLASKLRYCLMINGELDFADMFLMTEYPEDIWPLYTQSHSLVTFLVAQGEGGISGRRKILKFAGDLTANPSRADEVVARHYGYPTLADLQASWRRWVKDRQPGFDLGDGCGKEVEPYRWRAAAPDLTSE